MNIVGIDPGFSGGITVMSSSGMILLYKRMPIKEFMEGKEKRKLIDISQIAGILAKYEPSHMFIEKAQAMPKNGVVGMFNYGVGYGMILGLCMALEPIFQTHPVPPRTWQKFMYAQMQGVEDMEPKARAYARFYELWPDLAADGLKHDGVIDSVLIAEYGRRFLNLH